jgi:hypothetical protein
MVIFGDGWVQGRFLAGFTFGGVWEYPKSFLPFLLIRNLESLQVACWSSSKI